MLDNVNKCQIATSEARVAAQRHLSTNLDLSDPIHRHVRSHALYAKMSSHLLYANVNLHVIHVMMCLHVYIYIYTLHTCDCEFVCIIIYIPDAVAESIEHWSRVRGIVDSNPGRVKPMTYKIDPCCFLARCSALLG